MRLALFALLLVACAPPSIDDCTVGSTWAECPGSGGPTLACDASDETPCYWVSGTIPSGYGPCAAYDGCCVFASRANPWDRTRERNVSVVLAPVSSDARPAITCDGSGSNRYAGCLLPGIPAASAQRIHGTVTGTVWTENGIGGDWLSVDIARAADGSLSASICHSPWDDEITGYCAATRTDVCATSGTITMAAWPDADGAVALDAHFVLDGVTVDLRM